MIKWRIEKYSTSIVRVECERETESSVWVKSKYSNRVYRNAKHSDSTAYCDTWEAARDALLARCQSRLNGLRIQLLKAEGDLGNVKGMKKPEDA